MTTASDLIANGLMAASRPSNGLRGSAHSNAKLTEADVATMRKRRAEGQGLAELARIYGVSPKTVSSIVRRESWRHVP